MEKAAEVGKNNPCKCLEEIIRAMLKCLGFDTTCSDHHQTHPSSAAHQITSTSSSSSDDEMDGGDQKCSSQQLLAPADDPPPSTNVDPPQPVALRMRRPTRPGLGSSGDPQTNDTSS